MAAFLGFVLNVTALCWFAVAILHSCFVLAATAVSHRKYTVFISRHRAASWETMVYGLLCLLGSVPFLQ